MRLGCSYMSCFTIIYCFKLFFYISISHGVVFESVGLYSAKHRPFLKFETFLNYGTGPVAGHKTLPLDFFLVSIQYYAPKHIWLSG